MDASYHQHTSRNVGYHQTDSGADTPPPPFVYQSLDYPKDQIRLVKFLPAGKNDPIRLEISAWNLDTAPKYNGVSYAWGEKEYQDIQVSGGRLRIRRNCYYALWQVRIHDPKHYVWIDAICIDQENLQEKGPQVSRMGRIFAGSSWIFACVGMHQDDSEVLVKIVSATSHLPVSKATWKNVLSPLTPAIKNEHRALPNARTTEERNIHYTIGSFMARPYFGRLWIVQEISAIGVERINLLCGEDSIPKEKIDGLWGAAFEVARESNIDLPLSLIESQYRKTIGLSHGSYELVDMIETTAVLECSDPRDRVYGTLPLLKSPDILTVDYGITNVDLAVQVTTNLPLESVKIAFEALEINGADAAVKRLIWQRRHHTQEPCRVNPGKRTQELSWKRPWLLGRWFSLETNESQEITAPLQPLPLDEDEIFKNPRFGLHPSYIDIKHRVLYSRDAVPRPVGLTCYDTQVGDIVVTLNAFYHPNPSNPYSEPGLILRHAEGHSYDVIGQCILFVSAPMSQVFEVLVDLHVTTEDIIAFVGQDFEVDWPHWKPRGEASSLRSERVETNPILSPQGAVNLYYTPEELAEARGEEVSNWSPLKHDSPDLRRFIEAAANSTQT